ncbi:nicotinate phosphoribosyltransferase [Flammeovirga sp. SubArs3]|uniref:nicotinate phosphoribosyltransferase n=1 Tax=Flammeovirga sp. SubArs3 TaxID=2995316 RepID=UPI00248BED93|nr:nicotinate phosphoribosyltransferase [Flammeovirga sp. SubArs3]
MHISKDLYAHSLTLLTDLYQITMAYAYWKNGNAEKEAIFHGYFRKNPFNGGFTICAGLEYVLDYLNNFTFDDSDLEYLSSLKDNDNQSLFEEGFINYLRQLDFQLSIDAVEEGTLLFPSEPFIRVRGPLLQCQLIETAILNIINFQTLIATKAARLKIAAKDDVLLEFGLRRAQGIDGSIGATRAAYIGGFDATSNVLAAKLLKIPVKGTHAHSWIMSYDDELKAFKAYAEAMPTNCIFLVDTYNTLEGVKKAIETGKELREKGHEMIGVRLDSGDLAYLSIEARKLLDNAGFEKASIVASNDLDEYLINSLKIEQGAKISVWGVGTKLVTAYDQPALGGVYKLGAIKNDNGDWEYKVKLSEQINKISNPGFLQVRRMKHKDGKYLADMLYNENTPLEKNSVMIDPNNSFRTKSINCDENSFDLLVPIFENGKLVYTSPTLHEIQCKTLKELTLIDNSIKRFYNPHEYPVGLEKSLHMMKLDIINQIKM